MKLKFAYERSAGGTTDIAVVTDATATVGDIAREILECDPKRPQVGAETVTLSAAPAGSDAFRTLDPERAVGDTRVASGWSVKVVPWSAGAPAGSPGSGVEMVVVSGPDAGRRFTLAPGSHQIGRSVTSAVVLNDPLVSKRHAAVYVGSVVELVDLNSANGIVVDGGLVSRLAVVSGQSIVLGDTTVRFDVRAGAAPAETIVGAAVPFNRSPRVEVRYPGEEFASPDVPRELEKVPFPWMVMVLPLVGGVLMYVLTKHHQVTSFVFMAMSPLMMLGNFITNRMRTARKRDSEIGIFEAQYQVLEKLLTDAVPAERSAREQESPRTAEVVAAAREGGSLLWTRRPEHWSFLAVRLGTGRAPSRNSVAGELGKLKGLPEYAAMLTDLADRFRDIDAVPIVEDPRLSGAVGVVGDGADAHAVGRALLAQWCGLHSPAELVVTAITSAAEARELAWLKWMPHTSSPFSPLTGTHLADSAATAGVLLARLEDVVAERVAAAGRKDDDHLPALEDQPRAMHAGGRAGNGDQVSAPPLPVIVLLVTEDAPVDSGRLIQLLERGAAVGLLPVYVAPRRERLPAACRTFVDVSAGVGAGTVGLVRHGLVLTDVAVETLSAGEAMTMARTLAAVVDRGAVSADSSDLPRSVPLLSLIGHDVADSGSAVVDRWRQNFSLNADSVARPKGRAATLRALVGQAGADAMHLDLRTQGPHALVGGTTGAGKSEFLQSWVLGMATEYSPDRVTFLFVDYKGGSAFAECVKLPHCVGLVTDLSPHLVRRALTSLRAELRHREHVLNLKKAKDLIELEKRGDPECPPALILVIDEFAALVGEVPEFVDGVVDIAQRGRSLGIHLIMATQRPAGVIRDNLRANTNLRIALRMADESDSVDVVGVPEAGGFDPAIPGRGLAKTGPGRLSQFQSAYAGGWSAEGQAKPSIFVHDLRFGAEVLWERDQVEEDVEIDPGPTDLVKLVSSIGSAADLARVREPRRPWLDSLERTYDLADRPPVTDTEIIFGVVDLPEEQAQTSAAFRPDADGHLLVYGTGGSGKSVLLRTLAAAAGVTPDGGPVNVYAIDFGSGGLRMLEALPQVGSVVNGDDTERVTRLLKMLRSEVERRGREYSSYGADSVTHYRELARRPDEPRLLLLLDGFPAFRNDYEAVAGRSEAYATFLQLLTEGRQLGIHVVLTADRPGSVPGAVSSSVPRRLVLRLAEDTMYSVLGVPTDMLGPESPPGRAILDQVEVQVAVLGGSPSGAEQALRLEELGRAIRDDGRAPVPAVASLPTAVPQRSLPDHVGGAPVLGISDDDLEPVGFAPEGVLLLGGPPGSGRSNALVALTRSVARWDPAAKRYYFGGRRSTLASEAGWAGTATGPEAAAELAKQILPEVTYVEEGDHPVVVVIESLGDFLSSQADGPLLDLIKAVKRTGNLLIAESETSTWSSAWPLFNEVKSARRGVLLQPDATEGEMLMRTPFPRANRNEFPVGRGNWVHNGKVVRVQLPLA